MRGASYKLSMSYVAAGYCTLASLLCVCSAASPTAQGFVLPTQDRPPFGTPSTQKRQTAQHIYYLEYYTAAYRVLLRHIFTQLLQLFSSFVKKTLFYPYATGSEIGSHCS
jgi:hypothetical protein